MLTEQRYEIILKLLEEKKQHYGGRGKRSVKYVGIHGTPGHHSIA